LELVARTIERCSDPAVRRGYPNYRTTVDSEMAHTEESIRRLEQLLAGLRSSTGKPKRTKRSAFQVKCRRRTSAAGC
jgi:hypothetical protein